MQQYTNILIGTPCYGGMVTHVYMQSVLQLLAYGSARNMMFSLGLLANDSLITRCRNTLFAKFLDTPAFTHLLFIDSDISFQPEAIERMLAFDQELVAGMYPLKVIHWPQVPERMQGLAEDKLQTAGLNYVGIPCKGDELEERDGFSTGNYAGTGFMLMKRSVAQKMAAAYPETKYKFAQTYPIPKQQSQNQYNIFDCMVDPDTGAYLSEDFTFCHRWRKIGGKIWLDRQSKLTHVGNYAFQGDVAVSLPLGK
ncbi:MAG: hypothetical protein PHW63_08400 [Alphaproteobacteria bacterium]|nr:hypothetical protein [Alphaproteobacteria bacterium]